MPKHFLLAVSLMSAFGLCGTVQATTVIRVDMQPNAAFSGRPPVNFTGVESNAAAADPIFGTNGSNTWNYLEIAPGTTTVNPSFQNLLDSTGTVTSVGISFTGGVGAADDTPIDNNGSDAVENDYFLITSTPVAYSITGLPADTNVALYLYSPNFSHNDSSDSVGIPSRAFTLTANGQTINVPSGTGTGHDALALVTTDSLGDISGTWSTTGNEGDWSGFQIAYPLPNPAAAWIGIGLVGALSATRATRRRLRTA